MNYPEDFLKLRSGPSPKGQADKRALDGVDSPFLTKRQGGTTTRKKDDFSETRSSRGVPQLVGFCLPQPAYALSYVDVGGSGEGTTARMSYLRFPKMSSKAASLPLGRIVHVGDKLLLSMSNNANDVGQEYETIISWPMTMLVNAAVKQRVSGEDRSIAKAVSYIDSIQITGMLPYYHEFGLHATGWHNDTKRYRYAMSCRYFTDSLKPLESRVPIFFAGNTGDMAMTQVSVPFYPARDHPNSKTYVIGLGRLQMLVFVTEAAADKRATTEIRYPYFANSTDHGDSWAGAGAEFLRPFLYLHPLTPAVPANPEADPPTPEVPEKRAYLDNTHMTRMADYHINVYLGNGKSILIVPNGVVSVVNEVPTTSSMAFLGTNGAGYTRLNWPADDWRFIGALLGEPENLATASYVRLFRLPKDHYSAQFAFGVGCMYVPVTVAGVTKHLVTYDFGSNWVVKDTPVMPAGMTGGEIARTGTVMSPYLSAEKPGVIIFPYTNYTTGRIDMLRTDGLFSAFKRTPGVLNFKAPLGRPTPQLYYQTAEANKHFTNFGGDKPAYIFPAFPGEFEKS